MLTCEQATNICNKSQYREASVWERIRLRWHVLTCKNCSRYVKKNRKLTSLCDKAHLQSLSEADKAEIKDRMAGLR